MASSQLIIIEVIFLLTLVGYLVKYYKSPTVTIDVIIVTFIAWSLGFAGTILLPYDMAVTLSNKQEKMTLFPLWETIYWSTFVLAWGILPIQMQYHLSGEFTVTGKFWEAIKSNLQTLLIELALIIIFIIYMISTKGSAETFHFIAFLMAMGNTYGVLLIIVLMGNGLVALPRRLWQMGKTEYEINRLYHSAISVESSFHDARFELEDCETEVQKVNDAFNLPESDQSLKPLINTIKILVDNFPFALRSTSNKFRSMDSSELIPIKDRKVLVELHAKVKRSQLRVAAAERRWKDLLIKVKLLQALQDGTLKPEESGWCDMKISGNCSTKEKNWLSSCFGEILYIYYALRLFWRKNLYLWSCRILSVICAFGSLLIFYSELGMTMGIESPIGTAIVALSTSGTGIFPTQLIAFLCLAYMSLCTFWSLFKMNLGWSYTLHGPHQSPDTSLLFNANYLSRLQFSLGYNFLLFLNSKKIDGTSFQLLMVNMEIVPLFGSSFAVYAPLITAIIGLFTFFNIYTRIVKLVGIQEEDSVLEGDLCHKNTAIELEEIEAGKKLVIGQIRTLGHLLNNNNNSNNDNINNSNKNNNDIVTVELIGSNIRRSDQNHIDSSNSSGSSVSSSTRLNMRMIEKNSDDAELGEIEHNDSLSFRDRARIFSNSSKPAYTSLRGSSPGRELDSSIEKDQQVISSFDSDWGIPEPTKPKKYGRYG